LRFLSSAPPETHGLAAVDEHGYPRPTWLSWSSRPLQRFCCRPGSAFVASSAPPSPFETASGSSLSDLTPGTKAPEDPLLEFASPSEPNRVSAARASVSRRLLTQPAPAVPARDRLSWSSCSLEHNYAGCPVPPTPAVKPEQEGWGSPNPHQCRPQGSCPSRRFWPRTRHARTPCGARRSPWRPDASRPCFMPLAPLESPYRAFPSRGAVPALAGLLLPCGFAFDRPTARHDPRVSRPLSPIAPTSRHGWPEGSPDWKAGTTVPWSR